MERPLNAKITFFSIVAAGVMLSGVASSQANEDRTTETTVAPPAASYNGLAPSGGCYEGPARLGQARVDSFLNNPSALMEDFLDGGSAMSREVRALAGSDSRTIEAIVKLGEVSGNLDQIAAIGAGLARAAEVCVRVRPDITEYIQVTVGSADNLTLTATFLALTSDIQTAGISTAAVNGSPARVGGGIAAGAGAAGYDGAGSIPQAYNNFAVSRRGVRRANDEDEALAGISVVVSPTQ